MPVLLAEEAAETGVVDEADVEPPNKDLFDVGKPDTGVDVDPKEVVVELPNNEVVLPLPEVGKRGGAGVVPKALELFIIEDAKTFEVLVGLDLGREGLSVADGVRENIPDGGPNGVELDGVEGKVLLAGSASVLDVVVDSGAGLEVNPENGEGLDEAPVPEKVAAGPNGLGFGNGLEVVENIDGGAVDA